MRNRLRFGVLAATLLVVPLIGLAGRAGAVPQRTTASIGTLITRSQAKGHVQFGTDGVKAPAVYVRVISTAKVSVLMVGSCAEKDSLVLKAIAGIHVVHAVPARTWKVPLPDSPNMVGCHLKGNVDSSGNAKITVEIRAPEAGGPQVAPPVPPGSAPGTVFASAYAPGKATETGSFTPLPHALYVHVVGTSSLVQVEASVACTTGGAKVTTVQGKPPRTWKVPLPGGHGGGCAVDVSVLNAPGSDSPLWVELRKT